MAVERNVDQQLVVRVQKGDKTAFDLLVLKYQHRIAKLVSRYVADRAEVDDVTQEAFIKAYRAIKGFRSIAPSILGCIALLLILLRITSWRRTAGHEG